MTKVRVAIGAERGSNLIGLTELRETPLPCGGCSREWLRGWYSRPDLEGTGSFYHKSCVEGLYSDALVAAKVFEVVLRADT